MTKESKALVLMLASNPHTTSPIQLDEEAREVRLKLRESELRDRIRLETYWSVRPAEILQGLNQHQPDIVHFSAHGTQNSEVLVSSSTGEAHPISEEALVALFEAAESLPQCVVLNSCFSATQASRIAEHVGLAVGMTEVVGIEAAIVFSGAFYSALGYAKSYAEAIRQAKVSLLLHGIEEVNTPTLYSHSGLDPASVKLVEALAARPSASDRSSPGLEIQGDVKGAVFSNSDVDAGIIIGNLRKDRS